MLDAECRMPNAKNRNDQEQGRREAVRHYASRTAVALGVMLLIAFFNTGPGINAVLAITGAGLLIGGWGWWE